MIDRRLELIFPSLKGGSYRVTSAPSPSYNCIAWSCHDDQRWWWPVGGFFWPVGAPTVNSVGAFVAAYSLLGYVECGDDALVLGHEKIALYALAGAPTHAARQLESGKWTSKLGGAHDIEHVDPYVLEGSEYGTVVKFFIRRLGS